MLVIKFYEIFSFKVRNYCRILIVSVAQIVSLVCCQSTTLKMPAGRLETIKKFNKVQQKMNYGDLVVGHILQGHFLYEIGSKVKLVSSAVTFAKHSLQNDTTVEQFCSNIAL